MSSRQLGGRSRGACEWGVICAIHTMMVVQPRGRGSGGQWGQGLEREKRGKESRVEEA